MFSGETRWNNTTKVEMYLQNMDEGNDTSVLQFPHTWKNYNILGLSLALVSLVHKHVKMSVGKWILETHPHKLSKFLRTIF